MLKLLGTYYPPASARREFATMALGPHGHICLVTGGQTFDFEVEHVTISHALGGLPRVFEFPDHGKFECGDVPEIGEWVEAQGIHRGSRFVRSLERRWRWVAASVVLVAAVVAWVIVYGIPLSAGWLSMLVPDRVRVEIGNQTEMIVARVAGGPGKLGEEVYEPLREAFAVLTADYDKVDLPLTLEFRTGGAIGPNAFAFSNGSIVLTDAMIELAGDADALLGVLAHEVAHVHHRHNTQIAIQASSLPVLVTLLTGDLGSGSALLGTIPISIVQNGYSRDHEREADLFARDLLRAHGISTQPLADLFDRINEEYGDVPGWLSSHPASIDRVVFFQDGNDPRH